MKRIFLGLVGAVMVLVLIAMGFTAYKQAPVEAFCAGIQPNDTPQSILARAEREALPAFDNTDTRGVVTVLNQKSPFGRFACEVAFRDGAVQAQTVVAAD